MSKKMNALFVGAMSLLFLTACTEGNAKDDIDTSSSASEVVETSAEKDKSTTKKEKNPYHNYMHKLKVEKMPNEFLEDYNYKAGLLTKEYNIEEMSFSEQKELFFSDEVALEAMDFFQKPVLIEEYYQKEVAYEFSGYHIDFFDIGKDHNVYRMMRLGDDSDQFIHNQFAESNYDPKTDTFDPYRQKNEPAGFSSSWSDEEMLNYFNAYRSVSDSLKADNSYIFPTGNDSTHVGYNLTVLQDDTEISYSFDFLYNEGVPEAYQDEFKSSYWTFVFDKAMNLKRLEKHRYSSGVEMSMLSILYRSQSSSVDDSVKKNFNENIYETYKEHFGRNY